MDHGSWKFTLDRWIDDCMGRGGDGWMDGYLDKWTQCTVKHWLYQ